MDLAKALRDRWVWGQIGLIAVILLWAPLVPRFVSLGQADFLLNRVDPFRIRLVGWALMAVGAGLAGWGARSLGPSLTPGTEPLPGADLVTAGAYAHVRHPIYAGLVLALAGYSLGWSNWTAALIAATVALLYFDAKARAEERWLVERYPQYQRYRLQVRRRVW
jgi:protein-S-isoprenylcysteine O-methyltransferase Ste14